VVPLSQPVVSAPEEELYAYGELFVGDLSHVQPRDIGWFTKINISSLSTVALDLVSAPASQEYTEGI